MRKVWYDIHKESIDDMIKAGRFNPSLELTFRDKSGIHTHKIEAGHADEIDVYRDGKETYILTRHFGLGYVGLEMFEGADKVGEMFLQNNWNVEEVIGNTNLAPYTIIKLMAEHIY